MSDNLGKKFETKFKEDFLKVSNATIDRLYDPTSGYVSISNISDFIGYIYPNIYYIELKSRKGASLSFDGIPQYDKLIKKVGIKGVRAGIILWLYEKDRVFYIPMSTIKQMMSDGKKSVGIKAVEEGYNIIEIPSIKKRVFMDSDYSILTTLKDGE